MQISLCLLGSVLLYCFINYIIIPFILIFIYHQEYFGEMNSYINYIKRGNTSNVIYCILKRCLQHNNMQQWLLSFFISQHTEKMLTWAVTHLIGTSGIPMMSHGEVKWCHRLLDSEEEIEAVHPWWCHWRRVLDVWLCSISCHLFVTHWSCNTYVHVSQHRNENCWSIANV